MHLLKKKKFKESAAKFYAAQVILALGYLHNKKIIYRDLKLENILVEEDGYIVISDFGLSKILSEPNQLTETFCGTAAYLAPEIIRGSSYDKTVDWWALGILLYEMLHGLPPFFDRNMYTMFEKIKTNEPQFSPDISESAKDLITKVRL